MRCFELIIVVAALSAAPAAATDAITLPAGEGLAVPVADEGFDWNGFYAGVYGVAESVSGEEVSPGLGIALGANAQFDFYLVGGEVAVHGDFGADPSTYGEALVRGGVLLTDDVAVYATAGLGTDLGAPDDTNALLGGGVELAVNDRVTVRAQYVHGFPLSDEPRRDQFSLGANFHF